MTARVSVDDLEFAVTWLGDYDGAEDDENNERAKRVAAWIEVEVARRAEDREVRKIVRDVAASGKEVTEVEARAALRRVLAQRAARRNAITVVRA